MLDKCSTIEWGRLDPTHALTYQRIFHVVYIVCPDWNGNLNIIETNSPLNSLILPVIGYKIKRLRCKKDHKIITKVAREVAQWLKCSIVLHRRTWVLIPVTHMTRQLYRCIPVPPALGGRSRSREPQGQCNDPVQKIRWRRAIDENAQPATHAHAHIHGYT